MGKVNFFNLLDASDKVLAEGCCRGGLYEEDHEPPTSEDMNIS